MIRRTTWIVLAVFLVLVAGAFFMDKNKVSLVQTTPTPTLAAPILADWPLSTINRIELKQPKKNNVILQKSGDTWTSASLQAGQVDQGKVEQVVASLGTIQSLGTYNLSLTSGEVGLGTPSSTLILTATNGSKKTLKIGNLTLTESGYYAQMDADPKVLVLEKGAVDEIITPLQPDQLFIQPQILSTPGTPTTSP
jgi:hypothetical protein